VRTSPRRQRRYSQSSIIVIAVLLAALASACGASVPAQTDADIDEDAFYGKLVEAHMSMSGDYTQNTMKFEVKDQVVLGHGSVDGEITLVYSAIHSGGWDSMLVKGNVLRVTMGPSRSGDFPSMVIGIEDAG
jgi:hypothetical protein